MNRKSENKQPQDNFKSLSQNLAIRSKTNCERRQKQIASLYENWNFRPIQIRNANYVLLRVIPYTERHKHTHLNTVGLHAEMAIVTRAIFTTVLWRSTLPHSEHCGHSAIFYINYNNHVTQLRNKRYKVHCTHRSIHSTSTVLHGQIQLWCWLYEYQDCLTRACKNL
jgi:hypothetical protein